MNSTNPKRPDLNLCINIADRWIQVGAAWTNSNGNIRIVVNPLVQLPVGEIVLMLFPNKENEYVSQTKQKTTKTIKPQLEDGPFND